MDWNPRIVAPTLCSMLTDEAITRVLDHLKVPEENTLEWRWRIEKMWRSEHPDHPWNKD